MSSKTIVSYFSKNGVPSIGLSPTIRIWELSPNKLLIGTPDGTVSDIDGTMTEVVSDTGIQDGFYSFEFLDTMGYVPSKQYLVKIDGGISEQGFARYQVSQIDSVTVDIANAVWDEPCINHTQTGTVGEKLNQLSANSEQQLIKLLDVQELIRLILKYDTNRTRIDVSTHTLTVYDDDGVTPIQTFQLYDACGQLNVADVIERRPMV